MSLNLDPAALDRARRYSLLGLLLLTAVLFVQWIPGTSTGIPRDFGQYLTAAEIVKARDADALYFVDAMTGITTPEFPGSAYQGYVEKAGLDHASYYIYPPWVGGLYIPFTWISPSRAFLAMYALNWLFTGAAFLLLARLLPRAGALAAALCYLLLVNSYPFRHALEAGQASLAVFLLFVLMARAHLRDRDFETGIWWGIATGVKLFPILFLPYFLVTRRWRALAGFALVGVVVTGVSVLVSDVAALGRFLELTREYGGYTTTRATNFSLVALLVRLTEGGSLDVWTVQSIPPGIALLQKGVAGGLLLLVLASVWRAMRAGGFWAAPLSFALMTTWVLTSPANVWSHQMSALALPLGVAAAVGIAVNGRSGLWPWLWGGAWGGLIAFSLYVRAGGGDGAGPMIYAAVVAPFAGILLLYVLLFWMIWSVPRRTDRGAL